MAISYVGKSSVASTPTGTTTTATYSSTSGNTLVACIQHQGGSISTVTDSAGNTWTKAADSMDLNATSQRRVAVWYCLGASQVTNVTVTTSAPVCRFFVYEYSGIASFRAGAAQWNSVGSTSPAPAAPSGVESGDLVIGCIGYNELAAATRLDTLSTSGTGFSELDSFDGGAQPRISTAASIRSTNGAVGPTWTLSSNATTGSATAAFSGAGSTNNPPTANVGPNQINIEPYSIVTLDGSASSDADGNVVSYNWSQIAGSPSVTLGSSGALRTFSAPGTIAGTTLTFGLTVTDNSGNTSTQDTMTTTIYAVTERAIIGGVEVPAQLLKVSS